MLTKIRAALGGLALIAVFATGAAIGVFAYLLFNENTKKLQIRNVNDTLEIIEQNLRTFDIVTLQNISKVLFGSDYVTALKIVTGSGFVVFDQSKGFDGDEKTYFYSERRDFGDMRQIGSVTVGVNHDLNAARNISLSALIGGLLSFLLVRLVLSARSLRHELTVRKESERALGAQERNLRVLLNSLAEAVIATDAMGRVSQMNPVAERLTGWKRIEAIGLTVDKVFHTIDSVTRERLMTPDSAGARRSPAVERNENVILISRGGEEFRISQSIAPMIGGENRVSGFVIVFRDITAEQEAEQRFHEMEKMQAIGVLAGGIAHDFNNLLGVISAASDVIKLTDKWNLTPASAKLLETIIRTTKRGSDLTSRLLAVGLEPSAEPETFSLHTSIENVVTMLNRTIDKRFDVEVRLNAKDDKILGNAAQVENALLNIGLNASQAMTKDSGVFTISTENVATSPDDDPLRPPSTPTRSYLKITLRDDGAGIPPENLKRVFEPFFTNRRGGGGFGLGLWAVYNTVRDHRGTIQVDSQLGVETIFTIHFPCSFQTVVPHKEQQPLGAPKLKTILVVDDEEDIRTTLAAMLSALGSGARLASGGDEAIRIFREEYSSIDAVFMDLNMPGKSGEDTIVEILRIAPHVPIVISSGYPTTWKFTSAEDAGKFLFLKKPYRLADLASTITRLFLRKAAGA